MTRNDAYGPCVQCQKPTCSSSGYCRDCRTVTCACGFKFVAFKIGVKACPECRRSKRYQASRMGLAEVRG